MRLLVIEDNQNLVANLFDYFEARGHVLDAAPDGITGLHLASTQSYDVIVLDWMLPRMDGREVLRRLREKQDSGVPVIMLTARDELPDKIAGFRAGADDYLTKPFALPELEVRIEALLARAGGRSRSRVLEVEDLRLDLSTLEASRGGQLLHLYWEAAIPLGAWPQGLRGRQLLRQKHPACQRLIAGIGQRQLQRRGGHRGARLVAHTHPQAITSWAAIFGKRSTRNHHHGDIGAGMTALLTGVATHPPGSPHHALARDSVRTDVRHSLPDRPPRA